MKKLFWFLWISCMAFGQKIDTVQYHFPKIESSISMPIVIPISEVNHLVNQVVKGVVFEDNSYTDNHNDQFKTKVVKSGNITIKPLANNRILLSIPLKIWAEQGYGAWGQYLYQETRFGVKMNFVSKVTLTPDWHLLTHTEAAGFTWTRKPVLDYGVVEIPITSVVEEKLAKKQVEFTTQIDEMVKEHLNIKPHLLAAWNQLTQPICISKDYDTWLKITPEAFAVTPLVIDKDNIRITVSMDLFSETYLGKPTLPQKQIFRVPNFKFQPNIHNYFELLTTVNIPYKRATRLAEKQFLHQELSFREGKNKITIEAIKIYGGEGKRVVIEVQTSGDIEGTTLISGVPYYHEEKEQIMLHDIDFHLKTGHLFQKILVFLFKGKIKEMIAQDYGIPIQEMMASSRKIVEESLNKEYYPGLKLSGIVIEFRPQEVVPQDKGVTAIIDTKAKLKLQISGFNL